MESGSTEAIVKIIGEHLKKDLPFGGKYFPLKAVGKHVLLEIIKAGGEEITPSGIHLAEKSDSTSYAKVISIGYEATVSFNEGDYVELSVPMYPFIKDENGVHRFQLVHEDKIMGAYISKTAATGLNSNY